MKPYASIIVFLLLVLSSSVASIGSYCATEKQIAYDLNQALALTLAEKRDNVITPDTIRTFNNHLQLAALRGKAVISVAARQKDFRCYAHCSAATIFGISDQRLPMALVSLAMLWGMMSTLYFRRRSTTGNNVQSYGGLIFCAADSRFYNKHREHVKLTPMQQQLMEMFFRSPAYVLTKQEIYDALWPKKEDASDTLYTLIRRLKPIIEANSNLHIEADRGRAYELKNKA